MREDGELEDFEIAVEDFEERDSFNDLDTVEGDCDALVAGGDVAGWSGHDHD